MNKTILITGPSGLIGKALSPILLKKGYTLHYLSQTLSPHNQPNIKVFRWNVYKKKIDANCIKGVDAIIHLAGEGIANKRWTNKRKQELAKSRIESIRLIYSLLEKEKNHQIKTIISASAIGYYGDRGEELLNEESQPTLAFLSQLCVAWENAANEGIKLGLRVVILRTGIVLSNKGGALPSIAKLTQLRLGMTCGSGLQWVSWIHIHDVVQMYIFALENTAIHGAYNMVAPHPVTNKEMLKILAYLFQKLLWLPSLPRPLLRFLLGEMSSLLLDSTKASASKILATRFSFKFLTLDVALKDLYKKPKLK